MSTERKVALVTGSATGVGRACAVRFAKLGYAVVVNYSKSEADARETVRLVEETGAPALLCKATVADAAQVNEMIAAMEAAFDRLDVLVNNAGAFDGGRLDELSTEAWDKVIAVNLRAPFLCTRAAMRIMKKQGSGRIINVGSISARYRTSRGK